MLWPLEFMLRSSVVEGSLRVIDARGKAYSFGDGTGQPITVCLTDAATERALVLDPQLALGEAYMDGRLTLQSATIYAPLALLMRNLPPPPLPAWSNSTDPIRRITRKIQQYNPEGRARRNVARHYDID